MISKEDDASLLESRVMAAGRALLCETTTMTIPNVVVDSDRIAAMMVFGRPTHFGIRTIIPIASTTTSHGHVSRCVSSGRTSIIINTVKEDEWIEKTTVVSKRRNRSFDLKWRRGSLCISRGLGRCQDTLPGEKLQRSGDSAIGGSQAWIHQSCSGIERESCL
jgi:hypothetical protein